MLDETQQKLCQDNETDYSDLKAVLLNCTLKRSPEPSHTDDLLGQTAAIFEKNGVAVTRLRPVDHDIAPGVETDMTEHGAAKDDWPKLWKDISAADILVIATPIWLGEKSSVATRVVERLYAHSSQTNAKDQFIFYGKVAGCVVTGNEDGIKHCSMNLLYSLQHIGCAIPPQADAGWIGEAGPGPSYGDTLEGGGHVGYDNDFTRRNTTFAAWNMLHFARMLKDAGGVPAHGNQKSSWEAGCRFDSPNPEHR